MAQTVEIAVNTREGSKVLKCQKIKNKYFEFLSENCYKIYCIDEAILYYYIGKQYIGRINFIRNIGG